MSPATQQTVSEIWSRLRALGVVRKRDKRRLAGQLLRLARSTTFPAEAELARRIAGKLQERG